MSDANSSDSPECESIMWVSCIMSYMVYVEFCGGRHVLWWCLLLPTSTQIQTLAAVSHAVKMRSYRVLKKAYLPGENAAGLQNRLPLWQRDLPMSLARTVTVLPHHVGSYSNNSGKRNVRMYSKKQCLINYAYASALRVLTCLVINCFCWLHLFA